MSRFISARPWVVGGRECTAVGQAFLVGAPLIYEE